MDSLQKVMDQMEQDHAGEEGTLTVRVLEVLQEGMVMLTVSHTLSCICVCMHIHVHVCTHVSHFCAHIYICAHYMYTYASINPYIIRGNPRALEIHTVG